MEEDPTYIFERFTDFIPSHDLFFVLGTKTGLRSASDQVECRKVNLHNISGPGILCTEVTIRMSKRETTRRFTYQQCRQF